jgi:hypothetical protein
MGFTSDDAQNHGGHYLSAIGQLKPGASLEQARSEMSVIAGRLAQQYPDANAGWNVKLMPLQEFIVSSIEPALLVLLGAVAFVLLIACANVANLLLARRRTTEGSRDPHCARRWSGADRPPTAYGKRAARLGGWSGGIVAGQMGHGLVAEAGAARLAAHK